MEQLSQWFIETADAEAKTNITVGVSRRNPRRHLAADYSLSGRAVGKLFEFARRAMGLSIDELASRSKFSRAELVCLEAGRVEDFPPTRVAELAREVQLPEKGILRLIEQLAHPSAELSRVAESLVFAVHDPLPLPKEAIAFRDLVGALEAD